MASMSAHALGMLKFAIKHPGEWHSWDKKDRKTRNAVARLQVLDLIEAQGTQFRLSSGSEADLAAIRAPALAHHFEPKADAS